MMKTIDERFEVLQALVDDGSDRADRYLDAMIDRYRHRTLDDRRQLQFLRWARDEGNDIGPDDIEACDWDSRAIEWATRTYLVVTDDEADEACRQYIEDSLWAFNASFLADMTDIPQDVFEAMQPKGEDANDAIRKVIDKTCGLADFVRCAVQADGRGHFLSSWDDCEHESGEFFIYRN